MKAGLSYEVAFQALFFFFKKKVKLVYSVSIVIESSSSTLFAVKY